MNTPFMRRWVFAGLVAAVSAVSVWVCPSSAKYTGDGEALGVLAAIDRNEIAAADLAVKKGVVPDVTDFAKMMQKDHAKNLSDTEALILKVRAADHETSGASVALRIKGEKDLAVLTLKDGAAFSLAYMSAMVQGHTEALDTLDNKLLREAVDPDVLKHLRDTRDRVSAHLKEAQKVLAGLQK